MPYPSSDMDEMLEDDSEWCAPTFVTWENKERPDCTVLNVDSPDYPGLLRILAWAMNGKTILPPLPPSLEHSIILSPDAP